MEFGIFSPDIWAASRQFERIFEQAFPHSFIPIALIHFAASSNIARLCSGYWMIEVLERLIEGEYTPLDSYANAISPHA
jgi:hypothetical protein